MHSGRRCKACYLAVQRKRGAAYRAKTERWTPPEKLTLAEKVGIHIQNPIYARWV